MKLDILSLPEATLDFSPRAPTYAIRIFNSNTPSQRQPLKLSRFYEKELEYIFDEEIVRIPNRIMFSDNIATKIIADFQYGAKGCDAIVVHCRHGLNRSPAVGLALNQIFNLGNDSWQMNQDYPILSRVVYREMLRIAQKLEIISSYQEYRDPLHEHNTQYNENLRKVEIVTPGRNFGLK
jgi:predicted protein tyrosine phosphatase